MGKLFKSLTLLLTFAGLNALYAQTATPSFKEVDSVSLYLYQSGNWKELIRYNSWALLEGYDYYYIRMRTGIAWYQQKNYLQAIRQFKEALRHNDSDPLAQEYLFGCYTEMNQSAEAMKTWRQLPSEARKRLQEIKPRLTRVDLSTGPLFSDQPQKYDQFDLDGEQDIYGEADLVTGGMNVYAGLSKLFSGGYGLYAGYSTLRQDKNKLVRINDSLSVDDQYPLRQHQFYLNAMLPVIRNFSVTLAANYIIDRYNIVMPVYHETTGNYSFPVDSVKMEAFIGYLSLTRDFQAVKSSLFAAWSNLNEQEQIQAGFRILAYPLGNLNFYLSSELLNHMNDGKSGLVFGLMTGVRLAKTLWAETNLTVGDMRNYHEQNGYAVYNLADDLKFKAGGKLMLKLEERWMVTGEYIYMLRQGNYITYEKKSDESEEVIPITIMQNFNNHLIILTLSFKF